MINASFKVFWNNPIEMTTETSLQELEFNLPLGAIIIDPSNSPDLDNYYTKAEVDTEIAETKTYVDGKVAQTITHGVTTGFDWITATTISGFTLNAQVTQGTIPLKLAKKDGLLWLSGSLSVSGSVLTTGKIFSLINSGYKIERFATPAVDVVVTTMNITEMQYNFGTNPSMNARLGQIYMTATELYLKMQFNTPNDGGMLFFSPTPLGRLV